MSTPSDKQNKVVELIQKLFALSKSDNTHEAALAAARMQEMLAQHNLDLAMVLDQDVQDEKREKTKVDRAAKFKWQKELWQALSEANFCWYWLQDIYGEAYEVQDRWGLSETRYRRVKRHVILGRMSNVQAVQMLGEYLEDTMKRLCPYSTREKIVAGPSWARGGLSQRHSQIWYAGCVSTLVERINEKAEKLRAQKITDAGANSMALVTLNDVYQQEYVRNYDALHGAGAYKRKQIADEKWEQDRQRRMAEAEAARIQAEKDWLVYLQNETPDQKAAREKEEEKERRKEERRYARSRYSYRSSRYDTARSRELELTEDEDYRAGARAGKGIGLDAQVGSHVARRLK